MNINYNQRIVQIRRCLAEQILKYNFLKDKVHILIKISQHRCTFTATIMNQYGYEVEYIKNILYISRNFASSGI